MYVMVSVFNNGTGTTSWIVTFLSIIFTIVWDVNIISVEDNNIEDARVTLLVNSSSNWSRFRISIITCECDTYKSWYARSPGIAKLVSNVKPSSFIQFLFCVSTIHFWVSG